MDVSSVMSNYEISSMFDNSNSMPLVNNLTSAIDESYTVSNYLGETNSNELQDIYESVDPSYNMPVTYDQNGNMTYKSESYSPVSAENSYNSSMLALINSEDNSNMDPMNNVLAQYDSIEDGTYITNISSILQKNDGALYNALNASQSIGTNINILI